MLVHLGWLATPPLWYGPPCSHTPPPSQAEVHRLKDYLPLGEGSTFYAQAAESVLCKVRGRSKRMGGEEANSVAYVPQSVRGLEENAGETVSGEKQY